MDIRPLLGDVAYREPEAGELSRADLLRELRGAQGLISMLNVKVDSELLSAAPNLKVVANFAVGYDNIDVAAACERGIAVANTPDVLTNATADFAFVLLLAAARRLGEAERMLRAGQWTGWAPGLLLGTELTGRRLGVVGAGRIGRAVLKRAQGFDMERLYCSPRPVPEADALGATKTSLSSLLRSCDFISLHCPLTKDTRHLIDEHALALMKSTAVLVNTSRGGCVDQEALASALEAESIFAAGLDVFEDEPRIPPRLMACERAILAPHIGSATWTARSQMAEICARAVASVLAGRCPPSVINPEVMA